MRAGSECACCACCRGTVGASGRDYSSAQVPLFLGSLAAELLRGLPASAGAAAGFAAAAAGAGGAVSGVDAAAGVAAAFGTSFFIEPFGPFGGGFESTDFGGCNMH